MKSHSAAERIAAAVEFIRSFPPATELLIIGASRDAVDDFVREHARSRELAKRWCVPESWIRDRTRARTSDTIPHVRLGRYVRFEWASPELNELVGGSSHYEGCNLPVQTISSAIAGSGPSALNAYHQRAEIYAGRRAVKRHIRERCSDLRTRPAKSLRPRLLETTQTAGLSALRTHRWG